MTLVAYLRSLQTPYSPRVHANGFLQIDITPTVRLHVWGDPRIPRQHVQTPIHDHAFSFTSRVLVGTLNHRTFSVRPYEGGQLVGTARARTLYQPHRARVRHGEDTVLAPDGAVVTLAEESSSYIGGGSDPLENTYSMEPGEFHETVPLGPAVSVIVKRGPTLSQGGPSPTVLLPVGVQPSNEFDRHAAASFEAMWAVVADVIGPQEAVVAVGVLRALADDRERAA